MADGGVVFRSIPKPDIAGIRTLDPALDPVIFHCWKSIPSKPMVRRMTIEFHAQECDNKSTEKLKYDALI